MRASRIAGACSNVLLAVRAEQQCQTGGRWTPSVWANPNEALLDELVELVEIGGRESGRVALVIGDVEPDFANLVSEAFLPIALGYSMLAEQGADSRGV